MISDGEIIFPEIPAYDINKDLWSYIYNGDNNEEAFLNSLKITFQDCIKIEKDTRNQSDCSFCFELYIRGILIPHVQRLSILLILKTYQPKLKKH